MTAAPTPPPQIPQAPQHPTTLTTDEILKLRHILNTPTTTTTLPFTGQ
jgi:hypothetical protein